MLPNEIKNTLEQLIVIVNKQGEELTELKNIVNKSIKKSVKKA